MRSLGPDVCHRQYCRPRDLALDVKAPLLRIGSLEVGRGCAQNLRRVLHVGCSGSWAAERDVRNRHGINVRWIGEDGLLVDAKQRRVVGDPITAADGRLSGLEGIPGETKTGSKIVGYFVGDLGPEGRSFSVDADAVQI